jgi:hypothetical protein
MPVTLSKADWVEIYYALDTKIGLIENGDYGDCDHVEAGVDCPERCDESWMEHMRIIMSKIGDDGTVALKEGVAPL